MSILAKVLEVYKKCDVSSFPIDCFDIIRKLKIEIVPYSSLSYKQRQTLIDVSKDAYKIGHTVYYNDDTSLLVKARIRFNLMHEVGHVVLGHIGETEYNETCANWFAGEILAPTIIVYTCFGNDDTESIVKSFNISNDAANTKIKICNAAGGYYNNFIPPDAAGNFPFDEESMKIYNRFYNKEKQKIVYNIRICPQCGKELHNGEECTRCLLKYLKEGSRSMFDGEYLFG